MRKENTLILGLRFIFIIAMIILIFGIEEKIYYIQVEKGNYLEEFRQMTLSEEVVDYIQKSNLKQEKWLEYFTAAMLKGRFSLEDIELLDNKGKTEFLGEQQLFWKLEEQYRAVIADLKCFPMGEDASGKADCFYDNSWYGARTYGGERVHEGTDIMTSNNVRGYFPVYSMTDGIVEKKGWLKLGGWRIGIRGPSGGYFYYAHLYEYAEGLEEGDVVKAGQLLGYAGDSGYSEVEGTTGNFDVHLHLGIYIKDDIGQEISVNPYWVLRLLENRKLRF